MAEFDLVIRNGTVATAADVFSADVGVSGGRIAALGASLGKGREEIDAQFIRVFAGDTSSGDIEELATRYDCRVVVVTAQDGAWRKDPFAASALYRLVEDDARWRIYRLAEVPKSAPP